MPANSWMRYNESLLLACQTDILTPTKPKKMYQHSQKKQQCWRRLAHDTQAMLFTLGRARHGTEKAVAIVAFRNLWSLWDRYLRASQDLGLQLCNAFIVPVFTCNMGACGKRPTEWVRFDTSHHRLLRQIIGFRYPQRVSNNALYQKCACNPLSCMCVYLSFIYASRYRTFLQQFLFCDVFNIQFPI